MLFVERVRRRIETFGAPKELANSRGVYMIWILFILFPLHSFLIRAQQGRETTRIDKKQDIHGVYSVEKTLDSRRTSRENCRL